MTTSFLALWNVYPTNCPLAPQLRRLVCWPASRVSVSPSPSNLLPAEGIPYPAANSVRAEGSHKRESNHCTQKGRFHMALEGNAAIGQSGGPTMVINASLVGAIEAARMSY